LEAKKKQFRRTQSALETSSGLSTDPEKKLLSHSKVCGCLGIHSIPSCDNCCVEQRSASGLLLNSSGETQENSKSSKSTSFRIGGSNEDLDNDYDNDSATEDTSHNVSRPTNGSALKTLESDSNNKTEDSEESEDEQERSRTPLLARHSSLEQKSKSSGSFSSHQNPGIKKDLDGNSNGPGGTSHCKRVSFSTRSLDGSQHYYHQHHKGRNKQYDISKDRDNRHGRDKKRKTGHRRSSDPKIGTSADANVSESGDEVSGGGDLSQNDICANTMGSYCGSMGDDVASTSVSAPNIDEDKDSPMEKRFALVPQSDSMIGGNLAGGPFPSQWLFQAVNVAVKAIASSMTGSNGNIAMENVSSILTLQYIHY
jgi:hypothetical protein